MTEEGDNASDERQLMGEKREETTLFVGSDLGLTRVEVAAAQVGQFSLVSRAAVQSVAAEDTLVLVGTDESVGILTTDELQPIGFGPATAVGLDDSWLYAGSPDGNIARLDRSLLAEETGTGDASSSTDDPDDADWEKIGSVDDPRRFDGARLAAADGVYHVGDSLESLGLTEVRDVAKAQNLAVTADGVSRLANGDWTCEYDGDATAVVASEERAHAIVDGELFEHTEAGWDRMDVPDGDRVRRLGYCQTLSVVSDDGTVSVAADPEITHDGHGGWRSQAIGVREATALAVQQSQ